MTLVEIILPDGKYRSYIKLVLGFVLIIVIISPINKLMNNKLELNILGNDIQISKNIIDDEKEIYDKKQKELIFKEFNNKLEKQIIMLINNYADVNEVNIYYKNTECVEIDEISIVISNETDNEKIKNMISDFYNLPVDNIYITVQKKS